MTAVARTTAVTRRGMLPARAPEVAGVRHAGPGISLGRWFGVPVRAEWSLLVIAALLTLHLGVGEFPYWHPDWSPALVWGVAGAGAAALVASVLLHELAHAMVARVAGVRVEGVTLHLLGGQTKLGSPAPSPGAEFWIAAVGPAASFVLGLLATAAGVALGAEHLLGPWAQLPAGLRRIGAVPTLLLWVGPINVGLALFNLVPGFPLDGGRVLRAVLWRWTGSPTQATHLAAAVGRAFAGALMGVGVLLALAGGIGEGLWFLLIGWFLHAGARAAVGETRLREALAGVRVGDVMRTRLDRLAPGTSCAEFAAKHLCAGDQRVFPVLADGRLEGLVGLAQLERVPWATWPAVVIADVMVPADEAGAVRPSAPAISVLQRLPNLALAELPVLDEGGRFVGLVAARDLARWVALRDLGAAA